MGAEVVSLVCFDLVGHIEPIDFFEVLAVTISQSCKLVVGLAFLARKVGIGVVAHLLLVLDALDVDVAIRNKLSLSIELGVEFSVLSLAVVVDGALLVNLSPKGLDEANIGVDARLVIFIHPPFVFVQPTEVLLQVK